MYCQHFGFREDPFGVSPDPRFLLASSQHAEASASLYCAIAQRRGFAVLIGAPGLGKTTLLVNLIERIPAEARVALFVHPILEGQCVLESILRAMDLEPEPDEVSRRRQFQEFLSDLHRQRKTCVIVFDEAQHLGAQALEAIRLLSNFETQHEKLIQFILAGQPGLARLLRTPECEQILQRINIVARLHPLTPVDVARYIVHRLAAAGAVQNPFSMEAMRAIAAASRGVPRNINTICFNTLTLAFAEGQKTIDEDCVAGAVRDLDLEELDFGDESLAPSATGPSLLRPNSIRSPRSSARPFVLAAAVFVAALLCMSAALAIR